FSNSGVSLSDGVVKAWGDIGFLAHGFRFWRFDTINGDKSLLAKFGFSPIPPRETDERYGKGFLYQNPETKMLIEFRRGYLLISDPSEGGSTLIIRNASPVFGRDTLRHAAYYLPRALTPKELETFNPQFLKEENSVLHKNWYRSQQPDGTPWKDGPMPGDKIQKMTQALMELKEDYARFKLDTQAFEGYGKEKTFTGHLSPGLPMMLKQALEWAKTPLTIQGKKTTPDLAFVHPHSPIWAPYERLSLQDPKIIQELQSFISGQWTASAYPNSPWMRFLRTGVEKRAELVFVTPEILPAEAPQTVETAPKLK
ncbi:MAG: hypothetical protein K2X66_17645, partial [Cyanobacteria bacterium]|nr:hypothetical protein [Cyanobacteriota bacterium]